MFASKDEMARRLRHFLDGVESLPPIKLENQNLEVKSWCGTERELANEIAEATVCLSNAEGGSIIVGVLDKKTAPECFKPCNHKNVSADWIGERVEVLTRPAVQCRVYLASDLINTLYGAPEASIYIIDVPKTRSIELHKFDGVCYKRKQDRCPIEYSTSADDFSEMTVGEFSVEAIDMEAVEEVMRSLPETSRYSLDRMDFLRNAGLVRQEFGVGDNADYLTIAGLLLFGKPAALKSKLPQAQVAISYAGNDGLSSIATTETHNIIKGVKRCQDELRSKLPIDDTTVQEVLANAFIHRDYRGKAIIRISISEDEVSFENPGSLLGGITPSNIIRAQPIYRNFRLAEGARQAGLCRKYGDGMDRIFYNCLSKGLDFPYVSSDGDSFRISFAINPNTCFAEFLRSRSEALEHLDYIMILKALHVRQSLTLLDAAGVLQRTELEALKTLDRMVKLNMILLTRDLYTFTPAVKSDLRTFEPESRQLGLWPASS